MKGDSAKASPPDASMTIEEKKSGKSSDVDEFNKSPTLYKIQVGNLQPGVTE